MIDLRSDTVTLPTDEMREAIARAKLGDDVYGEDPTVNRLEEMAASLTGKEAALLVVSGTMGNLAAMLAHCPRGAKAIVGSRSHTNLYEAGGASALGSIVLTAVRNTDQGELELDELRSELGTPPDPHFAQPALVALENTHNRCGGAAVTLAHIHEVADLAHRHSLALHLDGARIFNAAVALETSAREIAAPVDTLSFCLSKGLGCPVGSILCGDRDFIWKARRARKVLGGGMRQAGIIAAAGIVALNTMIDRLAEDHRNAQVLAQGIALIAGLHLTPVSRRTNMVFFDIEGDVQTAGRFADAMRERGILLSQLGPTAFRAVTHWGITRADVDHAVTMASEAAAEVLGD